MTKLYVVAFARWAFVEVEADSKFEASALADSAYTDEDLDKKSKFDGWLIEYVEEAE